MNRRLQLYFHRVVDTLPSNMPTMIEYLIMFISIIVPYTHVNISKVVKKNERIPSIEADPFIEQIDLICFKQICWNCMKPI